MRPALEKRKVVSMRTEQPVNPKANRESKAMKARKRYSLLALVALVIWASNAFAINIETHFIGGEPPANAVGKGNLDDIMNAAARLWASAYSD
jgi:hypothetical protein